MDLAVKIRVLLRGKPSGWLVAKGSDKMEQSCLRPFLIQLPPSGSAMFRLLKFYERCGSKITTGSMIPFVGVHLRIFLQPLSTLVLPTTKKLITPRRGARNGS